MKYKSKYTLKNIFTHHDIIPIILSRLNSGQVFIKDVIIILKSELEEGLE